MLLRRDRGMLAVSIMLDVAFNGGRAATISAADLSERLGLARRGMEPVLQALSRTGLLESVRGPRGGYRLGRARRDISLADILLAVDDAQAGAQPGEGPKGDLQARVVEPLWRELDADLTARLKATSLDDLLRRAAAAGVAAADDRADQLCHLRRSFPPSREPVRGCPSRSCTG